MTSICQKDQMRKAQHQYKRGWMCYWGKGANKDYDEAVKWYKLSGELGDADAQFHLGWMHLMGNGVEENTEEAIKWFKLSAAQGDADARALLNLYKQ